MKKLVLWVLIFVWLGIWTIFAQNMPDAAKIEVKDPISLWEATNLKITMMNNWSRMTTYDGTIFINVVEENWKRLKDSECTVPSQWMYNFLWSDLWTKEFQRWLEIKKEWTFYIEVSDLNDSEDKILWRQLVHVVREDSVENLKHIEIISPNSNWNIIGERVEIFASCPEIPNSEAIVYIDDKAVWTTRVSSDWSIVYTVWNIVEWQHSLSIEIHDSVGGNTIWNSDKIFFVNSSAKTDWIKNVLVDPERWLMVWDMTNITVYTDDMVESVKMRLSDRSENDSMVMNRVWLWEFNQNVWLIGSWEISLSFNLSSLNNTVNESYDNYKIITVSDLPTILNVDIDTDAEEKSASLMWDVSNKSIVSSYLVDWRIEWTALSWKDRSETTSFRFNDVPYDTVISLNITPYWANQSKHWAASKTIQFVVSKKQELDSCWNWICENWESHELCPQDCDGEWWTTVIPWPSCPPQHISARTTKIWDSYYLIWDKIENVKKYVVYSSTTPDWKDKTKVYETTDTSYEYPFDHTSEEDVYMYFWIVWVCEDGEELELTWATKVQVWPAENFFLLMCLTFLIYFWIKLFRQTEE